MSDKFGRYQPIKDRNVIPSPTPNSAISLSNIQGDIFPLFPKEAEDFIFFTISDVQNFKVALQNLTITKSSDVLILLQEICETNKNKVSGVNWERIDRPQVQIAFSKRGLNSLGQGDMNIGDEIFDKGSMRQAKGDLGSTGDWDDVFDGGNVHGVVIVAADKRPTCDKKTNDIKAIFARSTTNLVVMSGNARQGDLEHFGFRDGISQPALRGLVNPHEGQIQVDPGVIIMGYEGDPEIGRRHRWTKDGSIMVFQKLEQDVPEFERYLQENAQKYLERLSPEDRRQVEDPAGLFGAHLMGRWKSGAPLPLAPLKDNKPLAENMEQNNDFDYTKNGSINIGLNDLQVCPFTAHVRKTVPRNLDPYIGRKFLESSMILRAGIPYGDELSVLERTEKKSFKKRGLLFACYQSSLKNGFYRMVTGFAGNDYFPITSVIPTNHGQDSIIGGPANVVDVSTRDITSIVPNSRVTMRVRKWAGKYFEVTAPKVIETETPDTSLNKDFFVTSRGGEFFFVPSISTLSAWATT